MSPAQFELEVRVNSKYHADRYTFLIKWVRLEKVVLLASTTATIALLKHAADEIVAMAAAGFAGFLTIGIVVSGADEACHLHRDFYSRWNMLHQKFLRKGGRAISEEDLSELISESAEIAAEEPPAPNTSVLIHSQNTVLREIGSRRRISQRFWRRWLRNVIDGDADNVNPKYITVDDGLQGEFDKKVPG